MTIIIAGGKNCDYSYTDNISKPTIKDKRIWKPTWSRYWNMSPHRYFSSFLFPFISCLFFRCGLCHIFTAIVLSMFLYTLHLSLFPSLFPYPTAPPCRSFSFSPELVSIFFRLPHDCNCTQIRLWDYKHMFCLINIVLVFFYQITPSTLPSR